MARKHSENIDLVKAATAGDEELCRSLLSGDADPNQLDRLKGFRPLHAAAELGSVQIAELLVSSGADIDALTDPEGPAPQEDFTALMVAVGAGQDAFVEWLLAAGADVNVNWDTDGRSSALEQAASSGNLALVERLLAAGAKVPEAVLFGAVWYGYVRVVARLLEAGANANDVSGTGKPMLVRACERPEKFVKHKEQRQIVKLLLEARANLEARDDLGSTALIAAVRAKNSELAAMLLDAGANAAALDDGGAGTLAPAVRESNYELVARLIERGADPLKRDSLGESPLDIAKQNRDKRMVALLQP
jgi:ankyrin repeat protein